jgi:hypothetical protein
MSTQPRVSSAIDGEPPTFRSTMAHIDGALEGFGRFYASFWQNGPLSYVDRELIRLRNARSTGCGF